MPIYHLGGFFPLMINFVRAAYHLTRSVNGDTIVPLLVAIALPLMFVSVRVQILTVQDRVIRLEMRLRLAQVLPAGMRPRVR